jgi:hypothetical protein
MSPDGPSASWIGRPLRRMGFDRNQMRRSTDRIQAILRAVLLAAFVLGGPVAAVDVCHGVDVAGLRAGRAQAAAWHRVPAVVLHVTPIAAAWRHPLGTGGPARLSVQWAAPDGSLRTGEIRSGLDADAGGSCGIRTARSARVRAPAYKTAALPTELHRRETSAW